MAKSSSGQNISATTSVTTGTFTGQSGKFCIVTIHTSDADSITTPSGWTLWDTGTDGNARRYVFYRVLPSTASVTFSATTSGKKALTWDTWDAGDIDTGAPISTETPAETVSGSTSSTRTVPTATLTGQPRYALAVVMSRGGVPPTSWTPPAGFTAGAAAYNTSSGATTSATAYITYTSTGSQGGGTWTSDTSEARGTTYLIILQPGTVDGTITGVVGDSTADGGSASFTATSTVTGVVGDATAAGGAAAVTASGSITSTVGTATADGGVGTLTTASVISGLTGDAAASGGVGAVTATGTIAGAAGEATASGGVGAFSAGGSIVSLTGEAEASGETGTWAVSEQVDVLAGEATATGGEGVFVVTAGVDTNERYTLRLATPRHAAKLAAPSTGLKASTPSFTLKGVR